MKKLVILLASIFVCNASNAMMRRQALKNAANITVEAAKEQTKHELRKILNKIINSNNLTLTEVKPELEKSTRGNREIAMLIKLAKENNVCIGQPTHSSSHLSYKTLAITSCYSANK